MSFFDNKIAQRLGGIEFGKKTEIYKFELIKRAKAEARRMHPDVSLIDMGVGEPDWPADGSVVATLAGQAGKPENRFYADNGIPEFKAAAVRWLERVFGLTGLSPEQHILHGVGSKPILAMLPLCFIDPGDVVLTTVPGYPVMATYATYLGGQPFHLPLTEDNGFLPDLDAVPEAILKKAKLLYINYPNNPTGAVANRQFFETVVAFAHSHDIIVVNDAAYGALTYGGVPPLSLLSIDGAMEVGLEVHSLSKAFNMTGWRLGFLAGNPKAIQAYATIKDNTDSGQFRAIQWAGITALDQEAITQRTVEKYSRRFDLLVPALRAVGFQVNKPKGGFYCYVKAPVSAGGGKRFQSAAQCAEYFIREALISVVPWDDAGPYLRFSVTFEARDPAEEKHIIEEMRRRLEKLELRFDSR